MTGNIDEVVAQLTAIRERLAQAAVTAMRAAADAEHAYSLYAQAAAGASHSRLGLAAVEIRTAGEKSARYANLLEKSRASIGQYLNFIAPGSVPNDDVPENAMPDGERLVAEVALRESRAARYHKKATDALSNHEGGLKKFEQATTEAVSLIKARVKPGDVQANVGTPRQLPVIQSTPVKLSSHPVADVVIGLAGAALAIRGTISKIKKFRQSRGERQVGGDQV
ncbi:hypothetical protein ACWDV4_23925 [Micromonospora sp. NPDC003197]